MKEFLANEGAASRCPHEIDPESLQNDCDWLLACIQTLYRTDQRGRITQPRNANCGPAPIFCLGRTHHGNLWRVAERLPSVVARQGARLAGREEVLPQSPPPWPPCERRAALRKVLGVSVLGPLDAERVCFRLPSGMPTRSAPPRASSSVWRLCKGAEIPSGSAFGWSARLAEATPDASRVVALERNTIVSACGLLAGDRSHFAVPWVETGAAWQRMGQARRVLALWLSGVKQSGGIPIYMADPRDRGAIALASSLDLEAFAALSLWF